jgi:hypothetical protein
MDAKKKKDRANRGLTQMDADRFSSAVSVSFGFGYLRKSASICGSFFLGSIRG